MVLGLDIGSCYTKGVLFDGRIVSKSVMKTALRPHHAIECIVSKLTGHDRIATTGYGRKLLSEADTVVTEITAFAHGSHFLEPSARTIIDLGGQDSKIIKIKDGKVERFVMNDRCAAGTGNFIEKSAQSLNLSLEEFGSLAQSSQNPITIDSLCVVMAESEILSLATAGKKLEDIVAGVCDSLIRRIINIGSQVKIEEPILFCGGGALNPGLVRSLKRRYSSVTIPEDAQFIGALGAAVIMHEKMST
ncbi:MAG: 2-hydroxyglutaryl-CoA dehydratase [candidate division WOR-3 bacterium]|nr:MAG: 2-hydroxyglutaryl-CoA dehydratase [candidate division WOR-3 bacterium]